MERKLVKKDGQQRVFTHVHLRDEFPVELTIYPAALSSYVFKSSITGKAIERASIAQLQQLIGEAYPNISLDEQLNEMEERPDRWQYYMSLLLPLENVKQHLKYHPEGDVLYHSLQVFDLACDQRPYDEEFLLAALLHDVGKGIDPADHVAAALEALQGYITPRTAWLIEHHMLAHRIVDGTLGARAHRRLRDHPDYEDLLLLGECDRDGRAIGVQTCSLEDAFQLIDDLRTFDNY